MLMNIKIKNSHNETLKEASGNEIVLVYENNYNEGDKIALECDKTGYYVIQLDDAIGESLVYLIEGKLEFVIPFDKMKSCYSDKTFSCSNHVITMRYAKEFEYFNYRNIALNKYDMINCYPRATANVETRGESKFAAKNVINGNKANLFHGDWPYESWGINKNPKACLKLDFGREVLVDKVVIYIRADFPHDSYWTNATIKFSDNTTHSFKLEKTQFAQEISFKERKIQYLELYDLIKAEDESEFPALTQLEVYGK